MSGGRRGGRKPTPPEVVERIRALAEAAASDATIAEDVGYCARQVLRIRQANGIESRWTPQRTAGHGTPSRYRHGCRCAECSAANTARAREYWASRRGRRSRAATP